MPKTGEVYRDNYPYAETRFIRLIERAEDGVRDVRDRRGRWVKQFYPRWLVENTSTGRRTKVDEVRLKTIDSRTGYKLVEDASHAD